MFRNMRLAAKLTTGFISERTETKGSLHYRKLDHDTLVLVKVHENGLASIVGIFLQSRKGNRLGVELVGLENLERRHS